MASVDEMAVRLQFFAYGSLMCADILLRVTGATLEAEPARLRGYRRLAVRGQDYPGLIEDPEGEVDGRLYRHLPDTAWPRLDAFEGEMYQRIEVVVEATGGQAVSAWTYLVRPQFHPLLDTTAWDFKHFLAHGKVRFEARYLGFQTIDGD